MAVDGVKIWLCFATMGPGHLAVNKSTMNFYVYHSTLEANVRPSVRELKLSVLNPFTITL